jgi:hypothetical protein
LIESCMYSNNTRLRSCGLDRPGLVPLWSREGRLDLRTPRLLEFGGAKASIEAFLIVYVSYRDKGPAEAICRGSQSSRIPSHLWLLAMVGFCVMLVQDHAMPCRMDECVNHWLRFP